METLIRDSDTETGRRFELPKVESLRLVTTTKVNRAREELCNRLHTLVGLEAIVRIDFGQGEPLFVDCNAGALLNDSRGSAVSSRMIVHPDDLYRVIQGEIDPRTAMIFQEIVVEGDVAVVTRFCDRLAGRRSRPTMDGNPQLPTPTHDVQAALQDLVQFGYGYIKDALSPAQVVLLKTRLMEQAAAEREAGIAFFDGLTGSDNPPNQRVYNLVNKGEEFVDLLRNPLIDDVMTAFLGEYFLISDFVANIAGPGGEPQSLHMDQGVGGMPLFPNFAVGCNILWFLDDVTEANGGTRILPGSNRSGIAPENIFVSDGTIGATGPAGTALIYDSRVWHGTGANRTEKGRHVIITYFTRPWVLQQINPYISVHPEVEATFDDRLRILHGYRCTGGMAGKESQIVGKINRYDPSELIREMKPMNSRSSLPTPE